jgi:spore maturation protein CgeB
MSHTLTPHAGRKVLCVFGQHNYGKSERGEGYEYSNFLPAFRDMGCEVEFFDSFSRDRYVDFAELNRRLLDLVERFRPEVVFVVPMNCEIWLESLGLIRKAGASVVFWGADDSWRYEQLACHFASAVDLWVTTSHEALQKARAQGLHNVMLSQWAANGARLQAPLPACECRHKVSFVGSSYGNRKKWVAELLEAGIVVDCFGFGWPSGPVSADEIPRIIRESVLSLNFGDSGMQMRGGRLYRSRQIKARVFEVPGAGGCLLTDSADQLGAYLAPGHEIEVFSGTEDLVEKIRFLLAHPECRDAIAMAGFRKVRDAHTYQVRFNEVLTAVGPGVCGTVDMQAFDLLARCHPAGIFLRVFRLVYAFFFQLILGRKRGIRAARRVLYELSWRIVGRKTYMASGWVGRLFYKEC